MRLLAELLSHFFDGGADGVDSAGFLIGNLDAEDLLEFHQELDGVQGVGTQVVGEAGGLGDLGFLNAELVDDDVLDLPCFTISSLVITVRF